MTQEAQATVMTKSTSKVVVSFKGEQVGLVKDARTYSVGPAIWAEVSGFISTDEDRVKDLFSLAYDNEDGDLGVFMVSGLGTDGRQVGASYQISGAWTITEEHFDESLPWIKAKVLVTPITLSKDAD